MRLGILILNIYTNKIKFLMEDCMSDFLNFANKYFCIEELTMMEFLRKLKKDSDDTDDYVANLEDVLVAYERYRVIN
jgi:hypothetical protein